MALVSSSMLLEEEQRGEENQWYFSRSHIENNSPSSRDRIDWRKETDLRKSYCSFLRELGAKLKVSKTLVATATMLCHRFFLRKSHSKFNCYEIAVSCFLLATKGNSIPSKVVIDASSKILTVQNSFEILELGMGSKVLIVRRALNFDLNINRPYQPLEEAISVFLNLSKRERQNLAVHAHKLVDDALDTILWLQFKPRQIAAGALYTAAKLLKLQIRSESDERQGICWWHKFGVTLLDLEEMRKQMVENLCITNGGDDENVIKNQRDKEKAVSFEKRKKQEIITEDSHAIKRKCLNRNKNELF